MFDLWLHHNGLTAAWLLFSTVAVFLGFLMVYAFAVWDFQPKYLFPRSRRTRKSNGKTRIESTNDFEDIVKPRALTEWELGIDRIGNLAVLSPEEQRRLKLHEHIQNYARDKPEDAAQVIKQWLIS